LLATVAEAAPPYRIDRAGTIRWEKIGDDPADRPAVDEIVGALKQER
jgi:hypothetical protein